MSVERGSRLGPYEIVSRLGAGGMGEVWRATDSRLDRSVAIKILPPEFAQNAQLKIRFEREAKSISQLNHPNICTLHDVGQSDGVDYLVMELIDGETLADRLARGPLPLEHVLRYGREIADALDRAHRGGIIHRDLKPGNIMLTKNGAKLLDFGLAKASVADVALDAPTVQKAVTQEGTILGTFQYMSPEQLEGAEADPRTDIFALGAVLYEMATGRRAFDGKTKTSLIAAIVKEHPPRLSEVVPLTPPGLEHIISKCLEKDPADRWQSAHDIAGELRWISDAGSQAGVAAPVAMRKRSRERLAWALAALLLVALIAAAVYSTSRIRALQKPLVTDLAPPPGLQFNALGDTSGAAVISPDGQSVVYSATDGREAKLWLRSLVTGEAKSLNATRNGIFPFWSPDSRKVGFFTPTDMQVIALDGSAPVKIASVVSARGGTWAPDGTIVFTPGTLVGLFRVPDTGGKPVRLTTLDNTQHTSHRWPSMMPDGKRVLYVATNHQDPSGSSNAVYVASLAGGAPKLVMRSVSNAVYSNGYLFFTREQALLAQRVKDDLSFVGEPVRIADKVFYDAGIWRGGFSVAENGTLVFHTGSGSVDSRLHSFDRSGKELAQVGGLEPFWDVYLSPDDQKIAAVIGDPLREAWILDPQRNARTKLAVDARWVGSITWSPDGGTLYMDVMRNGRFELIAKRLAGADRVLVPQGYSPCGITADGRRLLLQYQDNLYMLSPGDPAAKPQPLGIACALRAELSPDGKWVALESNEGGRGDVYIVSTATPAVRWQVTPAGGYLPAWRRDGGELYFVDLSNRLSGVTVKEVSGELEIGAPETLFEVNLRPGARPYDVTRDSRRFLVNSVEPTPPIFATVVNDWHYMLPR